MKKLRSRFKKFLKEQGLTEVFKVNLRPNMTLDRHLEICEKLYKNGMTENVEYIDTTVSFVDDSDWDIVNKEWIKIFKKYEQKGFEMV